ncbi:hypothetical protein BGX27_002711 [Mortierella sp. AM989]|nr:hypothetical protein BGX27_002711 [Mortierella sp. AM989]
MLILRHSHLSSEDLITCERALLRFVSGRAKVVDLDFNVWDYTVPEIYGYILGMFVKLELVECLGITNGELLDFIVDVDRGYLATFYHSFYHAADVTAVLYYMLQGMRASQYLCKIDMASLLLAGLCHDIGHPGLNNLFQINAKTDLLHQYGEASVLEKYSCSLAMDLVTKHSLFRNISRSPTAMLPEGHPATEDTMRCSMIKAILATDMAFHYDMLNNLNSLFEATTSPVSSGASEADTDSESESESDGLEAAPHSKSPNSTQPRVYMTTIKDQKSVSISSQINDLEEALRVKVDAHRQCCRRNSCGSIHSQSSGDSEILLSPHSIESMSISPGDLTPEQRQNLCNCLLHAADISNAVKPWTVCKRWSDLVVQEFFRQGDIEKAQGLPVSPNMDRDQHNQSQISLGFGDFVVQPYFEALIELLPEASPILTSLTSNRSQWVALQKSSQQFGSDPYMSIDPLDDPSMARRPSYPELSHMSSGRRVSDESGDSYFTIPPPPPRPTTPKSLEQQKHKNINSGEGGSGGGGVFRQKRLASLQVSSPTPSIRQEYSDGYVTPKNQSASSEHIPLSQDDPSSSTSPASKPDQQGQGEQVTTQAGNRSSTPAVMMSKIKYDWILSPTLAEAPMESRFGYGPLDGEGNTTIIPEPTKSSSPSLTTATARVSGVDPVELSMTKVMQPADGAVLISAATSPIARRATMSGQ